MLAANLNTLFPSLFIPGLLLFSGDFLSTFLYHVPEHVFGRLHLKTHHSAEQDFRHYAVLKPDGNVWLDGLLGALPYAVPSLFLCQISPVGVITGLILGQIHVVWRHTSALGWQTPPVIRWFCQILRITTPEEHWIYHQKTTIGYGDIFTVFDLPARSWLRFLRWIRRVFCRSLWTQTNEFIT